jgi:hypothetical protein
VVYLGTISYSVYLVHALVLMLPRPALDPVPRFAVMLVGTLVLAAVTYHGIEKPGQNVGRRVISRYRARAGRAGTTPPGATPGTAAPTTAEAPATAEVPASTGNGGRSAGNGKPAARAGELTHRGPQA